MLIEDRLPNYYTPIIGSEYSMQLNASRIKVLQGQDDVVNSMKEAAAKELLEVSRDHHVYKKLLKDLIVQASVSDLTHYFPSLDH